MKRYIGIDIGASAIKVAELSQTREALELSRVFCVELNPKEIGTSPAQTNAAINSILKDLVQKNNIKGPTSVALAGRGCFIKFAKLPEVSHHKLSQIIKFEVQQQIPFPINEVIWDYQLLKHSGEEGAMENDVLIVAAKTDIVNSLLDKFEGLGALKIESVQPAQIAVMNIANFIRKGQRIIILDMGAKTTNIIILDDTTVWSRSILIAGDDITKALAIRSNISAEEAELKKRELDCLESKAITGVLADLFAEVFQSINYYKTQYGKDKEFDKIFLTGGSSCLLNIDKFFRNNLSMPVEKVSAQRLLKVAPTVKLAPQTEERLLVAIGLALKGFIKSTNQINLLPQELINLRTFKDGCRYLCGSLVISVILIFMLARFTFISNRIDSVELNYWRGLLNKYQNYNTTITAVQEDINAQKTKVELLEDLIVLQSYWLDVMLELQAALSPDMWYVHLAKEGDFLILNGRTRGTFSDIKAIKERLEQSKFFKDIQITYAKAELPQEQPQGQPTGIKSFSIKMRVIEGKEYFASFVKRYKDIIGSWVKE